MADRQIIPMQILPVLQRPATHTEMVCPHCQDVIYEKHLAHDFDRDASIHRDCGGLVALPDTDWSTIAPEWRATLQSALGEGKPKKGNLAQRRVKEVVKNRHRHDREEVFDTGEQVLNDNLEETMQHPSLNGFPANIEAERVDGHIMYWQVDNRGARIRGTGCADCAQEPNFICAACDTADEAEHAESMRDQRRFLGVDDYDNLEESLTTGAIASFPGTPGTNTTAGRAHTTHKGSSMTKKHEMAQPGTPIGTKKPTKDKTGASDTGMTEHGEPFGRKQKNTGGQWEKLEGSRDGNMSEHLTPAEIANTIVDDGMTLQQLFNSYAGGVNYVSLREFNEITRAYGCACHDEGALMQLMEANHDYMFIEGSDHQGRFWVPQAAKVVTEAFGSGARDPDFDPVDLGPIDIEGEKVDEEPLNRDFEFDEPWLATNSDSEIDELDLDDSGPMAAPAQRDPVFNRMTAKRHDRGAGASAKDIAGAGAIGKGRFGKDNAIPGKAEAALENRKHNETTVCESEANEMGALIEGITGRPQGKLMPNGRRRPLTEAVAKAQRQQRPLTERGGYQEEEPGAHFDRHRDPGYGSATDPGLTDFPMFNDIGDDLADNPAGGGEHYQDPERTEPGMDMCPECEGIMDELGCPDCGFTHDDVNSFAQNREMDPAMGAEMRDSAGSGTDVYDDFNEFELDPSAHINRPTDSDRGFDETRGQTGRRPLNEDGHKMTSPKGTSIAGKVHSKSGLPSTDTDTSDMGKEWPRKQKNTGAAQEEFGNSKHGDASDGIQTSQGEPFGRKQKNTGGQWEELKGGQHGGQMSGGAKKMYESVNVLAQHVRKLLAEYAKNSSLTAQAGRYPMRFVVSAGEHVRPKMHNQLTEALADAEELVQVFGPEGVSFEAQFCTPDGAIAHKRLVPMIRVAQRGPIVQESQSAGGRFLFRFPEVARGYADLIVKEGRACRAVTHNWGAAVTAKVTLAEAMSVFRALTKSSQSTTNRRSL